MNQKPKPKNEGIFAHGFGARIILQGFMFGLLTLIAFFIGTGLSFTELVNGALLNEAYAANLQSGQTMAFIVLAFSQIVQSFNMRSERSLFRIGPFGNKTLNLAALAVLVLTAVVLFVPGINTAFGLVVLKPYLYGIAVGLFLVPLVIMELAKALGLIKHHHHK